MSNTFYFFNIEKTKYKSSRNIREVLRKKGWKEGNPRREKIFTYSDNNNRSEIKTYLDGTFENIFLKHKLALKYGKYDFIPKSYVIETVPKVASECDTGIWFIKPSSKDTKGGLGIKVIRIKKGDHFRDEVMKVVLPDEEYVVQKMLKTPCYLTIRKMIFACTV